METVNVTYIGVIRNKNGHVEFAKEAIPQKDAIISELEAMVENPNRTIFDLQSRMDLEFTPSERKSINYLPPRHYAASYVSFATYPKAPTIEEYKLDIEHKRSELTNCGGRVDERLESYLKDKKFAFLSECIDFCQAYSYLSHLKELEHDKNVKMLTDGKIGWTGLSYQINDDIQFKIYTNFGYGCSSYFNMNLTYKGIDILPYSYFVKYYYADQLDIRRYTRQYGVDENCWDYAFACVKEIANNAINDEENFVKNTIIIMTSNMGADTITQMLIGGGRSEDTVEKAKQKVLQILKGRMSPEFLNRIDDVVMFLPLGKNEIEDIVRIQVERLCAKLIKNGFDVEFDDRAICLLTERSYIPEYGARPVKRTLNELFVNVLTLKVLNKEVDGAKKIQVSSDGERLTFINIE